MKDLLYIFAGAIGPTEWILIIVGIVILFGGRKIPELMKGLGQGIKEFKKASKVEDEKPSIEKEEDSQIKKM